jgi:hypothetical protein
VAGLFLVSKQVGIYRATRNFDSDVPIELKADITWLAEYSR